MSDRTYLLFSAGKDAIAHFVQSRTGFWASHCDFVLPNDSLLGSLPGKGVHIRPREKFRREELCYVDIPFGYDYMLTQIGKRYDYWAIAGLALPLPRNWQKDDFWYCSEAMTASLLKAGMQVVNPNVWGVWPRDLYYSWFVKSVD